MYRDKIVCGDVFNCLATVPDNTFHCVVTSPPYYAKRKYPIPEQIGWEKTPDEYVEKICDVFDEVKRILHPTGVAWLNIGDCHDKHGDVMFIPYIVALELKRRGWRTRSDIKWIKPNCRPESVLNRPTCSHETILELSKSKSYFFDHENVKEPLKHPGAVGMKFGGKKYPNNEQISNTTYSGNTYDAAALSGRRIRNAWYFPTAMYRGAHTATFPIILPEKCILASTSDYGSCATCGTQYTRVVNKTDEMDAEWMKSCGADSTGNYNGTSLKDYKSQGAEDASDLKRRVLDSMRKKETLGWKKQCECNTNMVVPSIVGDPFVGVGTSALAAIKNKRDYFGIDIDEKNVAIANERIEIYRKTGKI